MYIIRGYVNITVGIPQTEMLVNVTCLQFCYFSCPFGLREQEETVQISEDASKTLYCFGDSRRI